MAPNMLPVIRGTKLLRAIREKDIDGVYAALNEGASPDYKCPEQKRPVLHIAIDHGFYEAAEALLMYGANPNLTDKAGNVPLHTAMFSIEPNFVIMLLAWNADPNILNKPHLNIGNGCSPLHEAFSYERDQAIKFLLQGGTDPHVKLPVSGGELMPSHSIMWNEAKAQEVRAMMEYYQSLPRLPQHDNVVFYRADLIKTQTGQASLLDNPHTWRQWPRLLKLLNTAHSGELTKGDLLYFPSPFTGAPYLKTACEAHALADVVAMLNERGEYLLPQELAEYESLQPFLHEPATVRALFTEKNMRLAGKTALRDALAVLPDESRAYIPNLHMLAMKCRNHKVSGVVEK